MSKKINRKLKKIIKDIDKGGEKALKQSANIGGVFGDLTNDYLLPSVKTIGIPVASNMAGMLGNMSGVPMLGDVAQKTSDKLLKKYIPGQSKNKYVKLLAGAMDQASAGAMGGDYDPQAIENLGFDFLDNVKKDIGLTPNYKPLPSDDPYHDQISQILRQTNDININDIQDNESDEEVNKIQDVDDNDALYDEGNLEGDTMIIKKSPYQQLEGNASSLLGAGIKRKKDKKKYIYVKEELPHEKFTHTKNSSLKQLLEAKRERNNKDLVKSQKLLLDKQLAFLKANGY